ncbi:protein white-like [Homarus americanus]|uniref:protein white-like n=1 Tax=Homarus americanus TaxID=6706 RepID=UPI001C451CCE|nr:protein white-like [Homarus americanus]
MSTVYDNPCFQGEGNGDVSVAVEKGWSGKEKLTYSWDNVNVFASTTTGCGKKKVTKAKHILKNITGICRPGELLAIMGASGAGKTTLLNVLTFRSDQALKISGSLYVNGQRVTPNLLMSRSAYVQQEDLFIGTFTVREQLLFQANLRMDRNTSQSQRVQRVDEVMKQLSLTKCAKTLIGVAGSIKGISGGETKRLAFACEILTSPSIMLLDEPTSGLDSFMAQTIVQAMKDLASTGMTVISTIHQPSSEVFALFDRVLLMGEGRVAYLGSTSEAVAFFSGLGKNCPKNFNPADFFISTLAIEPGREEECLKFVDYASDAFVNSSAGQQVSKTAADNKNALTNGQALHCDRVEVAKSPYKAGVLTQFSAVLKRSFLANIREPMILRTKVFQTVLISLLVGVIYLNQELDQSGVTNINGAIFLLVTQMSFTNVFGVVHTFCAELPIFLREHFNGMYRAGVYFICKNLAELPLMLTLPALFAAITYYMIGLYSPVENFFICMAILILTANAAMSFGYMISCLAPNVHLALALSAPLIIPLMLFGGFFLNSDSVPVYFIWIKYISWFNYGNEALMINQWADIDSIACSNENSSLCLHDGLEVLTALGYDEDNLIVDVGALLALIVGYRLLGFLFLLLKTRRKSVTQYD